jgi:hypothetical protein
MTLNLYWMVVVTLFTIAWLLTTPPPEAGA